MWNEITNANGSQPTRRSAAWFRPCGLKDWTCFAVCEDADQAERVLVANIQEEGHMMLLEEGRFPSSCESWAGAKRVYPGARVGKGQTRQQAQRAAR